MAEASPQRVGPTRYDPNDPRVCWIKRNDDRLLSPCHDAPQHVAHGQIVIDPDNAANWHVEIDHVCSSCGLVFDPTAAA